MTWKDVFIVDGALAQYLRLTEAMAVRLREVVLSKSGLSAFPGAAMWPSPLWSSCLSALGDIDSEQSWELQRGFRQEQTKMAHRRHCATNRKLVSVSRRDNFSVVLKFGAGYRVCLWHEYTYVMVLWSASTSTIPWHLRFCSCVCDGLIYRGLELKYYSNLTTKRNVTVYRQTRTRRRPMRRERELHRWCRRAEQHVF